MSLSTSKYWFNPGQQIVSGGSRGGRGQLINNQVKVTNGNPFVNLNPLSRNPGSAPDCPDITEILLTEM